MPLKFHSTGKKRKKPRKNPFQMSQKTMLIAGGGVAAALVLWFLMRRVKAKAAEALPGAEQGQLPSSKEAAAARVKQDIAAGKLVFVNGHWERAKAAPAAPVPVNGTPEDAELLDGVGGIFSKGRGLGSL